MRCEHPGGNRRKPLARRDEERDLARALITGGAVGCIPDWYNLCKAAEWLNVAPWDLERAPIAWYHRAITGLNAEAKAREQRERQQNQGYSNQRGRWE
jgi:hypothetical protein